MTENEIKNLANEAIKNIQFAANEIAPEIDRIKKEGLLKTLVKSPAELNCIRSGGVAEYVISTESGEKYQFDIDISNKKDVGETASFMPKYDKSIILMRWIRKAMDKDELIKIS